MEKENIFYSDCECNCSVLRVEYYDDLNSFDVAIYKHNYRVCGIKEKIRWIWNFIRTGNPYGDDVILSLKDAERLRNYLFVQIDYANHKELYKEQK